MTELLTSGKAKPSYVLITPAHNEEANIERVILSVVSQTLLPTKWIIVSDSSTDDTDKIVAGYARLWTFIELQRIERHTGGHSFASKVHAFHHGFRALSGTEFDFVGNLDGDVSFDQSYYLDLVSRFERDSNLGIAGGGVYEWNGTEYSARSGNTTDDVAGATLVFRRECYEETGGFLPLEFGGEDWCTQITARMKGWRVRSFPELRVRHHDLRPHTTSLRRWFCQGRMDFCVGSHPLFEVFRLFRRVWSPPILLGAMLRMAGFLWGYCKGEKRVVSSEVVSFLRREELGKIGRLLTRNTLPDTARNSSL